MKSFIFSVACIFIVLGWTGCNRNEGDFIPIRSSLKAAFLFRPGSYWIYKDVINNTLDSVYLERLDSSTTLRGSHPEDMVEVQRPVMTIYRWTGSSYIGKSTNYDSDYGTLSDFRIGPFGYPFESSTGVAVTTLPTFTLQGNMFEGVTQLALAQQDTFTVKEHIGALIIRRRVNDTQNYEYQLMRWRVVQ